MKALLKFSMYLIAALMLVPASCSLPDEDDVNHLGNIDPENYFSYGVKSAKIKYISTNVNSFGNAERDTFAVTFDEYGKKFRTEAGDGVVIIDGVAGKMYAWSAGETTYLETEVAAGSETMYGASFVYLGDDAGSLWGYYPGFSKKSNRTIAGKSCSVVGWSADGEAVEWGGWNRITFWMQTTGDGTSSSTLEAAEFSESISADSFAPPAGYTKVSY